LPFNKSSSNKKRYGGKKGYGRKSDAKKSLSLPTAALFTPHYLLKTYVALILWSST